MNVNFKTIQGGPNEDVPVLTRESAWSDSLTTLFNKEEMLWPLHGARVLRVTPFVVITANPFPIAICRTIIPEELRHKCRELHALQHDLDIAMHIR